MCLLTFLSMLIKIMNSNAYEIASNHSYIKNSEFTTDHTISINGYGDFKFIYNDYKDEDTTNISTENEVSVDINLEKEIDEITKVGIHFIPTLDNKYFKWDRYYLYVDGYYGRLELGNTTSVYNDMRVGSDTIAIGSGGINGSFIRNATPMLSNDIFYILSPNSFLSQNLGLYNNNIEDKYWDDTKYLTKINYYTQEFAGFQVGFGITPNVKLKELYTNSIIANDINLGTFLDYGINYINSIGNVGVALSFVGENNIANSANKTNGNKEKVKDKFKSYEFGINVNYFGLTLAGSFGILDTSIKTQDLLDVYKTDKGNYATYGFAYEFNELLFSITCFESEYDDYSRFESISYAVEKKMYKGFSIYGEYTNYKAKAILKNSLKDESNKGNSIFVGILLNFD